MTVAIKYFTEQKIGLQKSLPSPIALRLDNLKGKRQQQNSPKILPKEGQLSQRASSTVCFCSNPICSDKTDSKFGNKTIASLIASQSNATKALLPFLYINAFF